MQRVAFLPFENLSGDNALDWMSAAGPQIVSDQLVGTAAGAIPVVPIQVVALRDAYAFGATQLVHGYFEKRSGGVHFEFVVEDAQKHKLLHTVAGDGEALPVFDRLAKRIDAGAHAFSSSNPQAVAAWAHGDWETAVSLDPDFGAAWVSWVQNRIAARDNQKASEIATRALGQSALRSPADRAQLELMSANMHQDQPAQQRALKTLAGLMPHDPVLLRRLAVQEMNARHYSESASYYAAELQENPDDIEIWNLLGYAQAFAGDWESARKSLERYGSDAAHAANGLDSLGEAAFLNGKFAEAERYFLQANAKNSAMLNGGDLLKAAYARWLQGDLPEADRLFIRYLAARTELKDALVPWRQAVWEFSTGRSEAAIARLASVTGPVTNVARAQTAIWMDPSKLPTDTKALKQAYERTPPTVDGITRVLYASALMQAGQKDEARKLIALWPLPGLEGDPLLQSFLFPKYLELKRELK